MSVQDASLNAALPVVYTPVESFNAATLDAGPTELSSSSEDTSSTPAESVNPTPAEDSIEDVATMIDQAYRTVCISNVSPGTAVHDVVKDLHFGIITKLSPAFLIPVQGMRTLCITFLEAESALRCMKYLVEQAEVLSWLQGISLSLGTGFQILPCIPLSTELYDLAAAGTISRVLRFSGFPPLTKSSSVVHALTTQGTRWTNIIALEEYQNAETKIDFVVHFNSLDAAIRAHQVAAHSRFLARCKTSFAHDPCGPYAGMTKVPAGPLPEWIRNDPLDDYYGLANHVPGRYNTSRRFARGIGKTEVTLGPDYESGRADDESVNLEGICWDPTIMPDDAEKDQKESTVDDAAAAVVRTDSAVLIQGLEPGHDLATDGQNGCAQGEMQGAGAGQVVNLMDL